MGDRFNVSKPRGRKAPWGVKKGKAAMIRCSKCSNIIIDGESLLDGFLGLTKLASDKSKAARDRYEASIVRQLDMLAAWRTGWAVVKDIFDTGKSRGKEVRIVPYTRKDEMEMGEENAFARATSPRDAAPRGVTPYRGMEDNPKTPADERYELVSYTGTGEGSDAEIHYSPEKLPQGPVPVCPRDGTVSKGPCRLKPGADDTPDATLVHELVHALREMRGQRCRTPTWVKGYDNEEEFYAILYVSEQGMKNLREDHQGMGLLNAARSTSEGFLGNGAATHEQLVNRRLVHKFVCQNHALCANISSAANAAFNPIREFMRNAQLYPLSPNTLARS